MVEETKEVKPEGTKEETPTESFKDLVERQEKANTEAKELMAKQEELMATQRIHGTTDAGEAGEVKKKEETPKEYKDRVMANDL